MEIQWKGKMGKEGKMEKARILAVDDEPDVIETIEDLLSSYEVDKARDYESALLCINGKDYDLVILDIMGVRGYDLLEVTKARGIRTIMLTAHALSSNHLVQTVTQGALSYIPKEKIFDIEQYVVDALSRPLGENVWQGSWFTRLRPYFYRKFGPNWRDQFSEAGISIQSVDRILVPTDFSFYSCEAFPWAAFFARKFNARVMILHVISQKDADNMISIPGNPWEKVLKRQEEQMIEDFSACLVGDFGERIKKETRVAVGPTAGSILKVAQDTRASMIVMSTHGRGGLKRALIGSVAEKVLRKSPCPVFTVQPMQLSE